MSDSVPLSIQHKYPAPHSGSSTNPVDSGDEMTDQPLNAHIDTPQNIQPDTEGEVSRSTEISQQLSDLSEQQAFHSELPREVNTTFQAASSEPPVATDRKSIYIGNVDYETTEQELHEHFSVVGPVERVKIIKNKASGTPKGFAYLEFASQESVQQAVQNLDGSVLRERELKVSPKRMNIPGMSMTERGSMRGRGRGRVLRGRGRGILRGSLRGRGGMRGVAGRFTPY